MRSPLHWAGDLEEPDFLERIYPLKQLPSYDSRYDSAEGDIWQHRINNYDWEDDWIFEDERFQLADGNDETFLKFLIESIHPVVRPNIQEVRELVDAYNSHLQYDGYELYVESRISGRPIYGYKEIMPVESFVMESEGGLTANHDSIWGIGRIRAFVSHTSTHKEHAESLKVALKRFDITAFVAHSDVEPTREWQIEIERALRSMHIMIPLVTADFKDSAWTDQEVGAAIGRNIPIIPIRRKAVPHGFMGKVQAIAGHKTNTDAISFEIVKSLLTNGSILQDKQLGVDCVVAAVANAESFKVGNMLADLLQHVDRLTVEQQALFVSHYNSNSQVNDANAFKTSIVAHLLRMTDQEYRLEQRRLVKL